MQKKSVEELKKIANDLRKKVVTMIYEAGSGDVRVSGKPVAVGID